MEEVSQNPPQYIRYKDIVAERAIQYYHNNKEKRREYQRNRYANMSQEQKIKLVEYGKEWINRQSEDKKNEMKRKAREYSKNRYHNLVIAVK